MLEIKDNKIFLTRGDNAELNLEIKKIDESDYEPQTGDRIFFRAKEYATKGYSEILVEKEALITNEGVSIIFVPEDTMDLGFKEYKYEVELVTNDDKHYTVIADQVFEIGKEQENHVHD